MSSGVQFVFYTVCYFRLQPVWKNKRIGMTLKVRLWEALMISTMLLLYSAELWLLGPISYSKGKKNNYTSISIGNITRKLQIFIRL